MRRISVTTTQLAMLYVGFIILVMLVAVLGVKQHQTAQGYEAQIDAICTTFAELTELSPSIAPEIHISCNSDERPKMVLIQRHMADGNLVMRVVLRNGESSRLELPSIP